jgi:uncharacterized protein (UPF0548 family)
MVEETRSHVFILTAPTEDEVRRFISKQKDSSFSYPDVGASATAVPAGYNLDHNRVQLGRGENTWQRALGRFERGECSACHG